MPPTAKTHTSQRPPPVPLRHSSHGHGGHSTTIPNGTITAVPTASAAQRGPATTIHANASASDGSIQ
jgi:hypothetical protein